MCSDRTLEAELLATDDARPEGAASLPERAQVSRKLKRARATGRSQKLSARFYSLAAGAETWPQTGMRPLVPKSAAAPQVRLSRGTLTHNINSFEIYLFSSWILNLSNVLIERKKKKILHPQFQTEPQNHRDDGHFPNKWSL